MKTAFTLLLILLVSCARKDRPPEPVRVSLPENADLRSPVWKGIDLSPKPAVLAKSPQEELKTFQLQPGYVLEPVLTEPQIEQPAAINFDARGRMYVLELRSYMLTADADAELEPTNVISRWEDVDNDGVYEEGTIFVDSLIFPRFVMPWGENAVLTMESNQDDVFLFTDTDNDGRADTKEFFVGEFGRSGNVEHQQSFLYYGMDNWMYSTYNAFRIRWTPQGILREPTGRNGGQWGVTQDNEGKIWFQGGASGVPSYFQFPIHYGHVRVEDQYAEGFRVPWGAPIYLADVQPGMRAVRQPDGSVSEVTGSAGNDVYRGHRLPQALVGQYFYGEPVARIVRQVNPIVTEGVTTLHNQFQSFKSEFIKSTDPLFRPIDLATAPDGTMYIVDMYHGIIQEGNWVQKGSYLRAKIDQYQLDKIVGLGRIWRLRYEGIDRDTSQHNLYDMSAAQVAEFLDHPNGLWRDLAQQELVMRRDSSVVGLLEEKAIKGDIRWTKYHALWTLEGMDLLSEEVWRQASNVGDPKMLKMALRVGESLYKSGQHSIASIYREASNHEDYEVVMQALLSMELLAIPGYKKAIDRAVKKYSERGVQLVAEHLKDKEREELVGIASLSAEHQNLISTGKKIYDELCATCHGLNGTGIKTGDLLMAPVLASSARVNDHPEYMTRVILRGMTGPVDNVDYSSAFMVPMANESDAWIASVVSYVRTQLGNDAGIVEPDQVAVIRARSEGDKPYTFETCREISVQKLIPNEEWVATASHTGKARVGGSELPSGAWSFEGWTTGMDQEFGMWFQIEMERPYYVSGMAFRSPAIRRGRGPDAPPPSQTCPASYQVEVSMDGENWGTPVTTGSCGSEDISIEFKEKQGRYLRITQTGAPEASAPWKMQQLKVYGRQTTAL